MADRRTLKSEFDNADGQRSAILDRARECAELTHPSALPRLNLAKGADLDRPWQSLGAYGTTNLTNKLLLTIVPVGVPMFQSTPSARIRANPKTTPESLAELEAILYLRDLLVRDQLEAVRIRTRFRSELEQIVIVGNGLSMLTDDYQLKVSRFDQFVQKRGSGGQPLWIITHEKVDPAELTDAQLALAELTREQMNQRAANAEGLDFYTKCAWQRTGSTVIRQELNGKEINVSEEPVSRYFPAGYVELVGEDYSRGFIEEHLGDLRYYSGLRQSVQEGTAAIAKVLFGIDENVSELRATDLMKPNLSVIGGCRINPDGRVAGVGCIQADKLADLGYAAEEARATGQELSAHMLIETAVQPTGDRVTAYQVNRIARELEGLTGGIYAQVAEELQAPLVKRLIWQMEKDLRLPTLDPRLAKEINIETLTGLEAMGRQRDAEKIQQLGQILVADPRLARWFREEWLVTTIVRGLSIDPKPAVKTKEEIAAEDAQQAELQVKMAMAQQAISSTGRIAENASKPQSGRSPA